jgi:hypothetical protein
MEYSWIQFKELAHIKKLQLNEQMQAYRHYLDQLSNQIIHQNKGDSGYILLEQQGTFEYPLDFLLNEDGTRIRRE